MLAEVNSNVCQKSPNLSLYYKLPYTMPTFHAHSCSHLLIYDVAYQEVTSEWYFRFNESATYTSLSSRLVFRLCMSSRYRPRDVKVRLKFEVQRKHLQRSSGIYGLKLQTGPISSFRVLLSGKEESFSGSSLEPPTWSTFQSPNFPNGYALRGERFIYSFHNLDPGGVIHVVFEDWDLTPMSRILVSKITAWNRRSTAVSTRRQSRVWTCKHYRKPTIHI